MMDQDAIKQAAQLIREHNGFYALTGAGMSTESGIPDFRSPGTGLWEKVDPIATSSAEVLRNNPRLFYEADVVIRGKCGQALTELLGLLG